MAYILFFLLIANTVASAYTAFVIAVIAYTIMIKFKDRHPDFKFEPVTDLELMKDIAMCCAVFCIPVMNIAFTSFCVDHYGEIEEKSIEELEKKYFGAGE